MLTPEQLESAFRKEREFRTAIVRANELQGPKPSIWPSVLQFALKTVPPQAVGDLIMNLGKAAIERRRAEEAQEDNQPPEPQEPKKPPVPRSTEDGRPKKDIRSGVTFVSTFVEPEKPVPKPE